MEMPTKRYFLLPSRLYTPLHLLSIYSHTFCSVLHKLHGPELPSVLLCLPFRLLLPTWHLWSCSWPQKLLFISCRWSCLFLILRSMSHKRLHTPFFTSSSVSFIVLQLGNPFRHIHSQCNGEFLPRTAAKQFYWQSSVVPNISHGSLRFTVAHRNNYKRPRKSHKTVRVPLHRTPVSQAVIH